MQKKKIVFIVNPISGTTSKEAIPQIVEKNLNSDKFDYEVRFTEYAGHAQELASELKDAGVDIVVAVGGDGTVNEVARALTGSQTALGIVPCGSGNGLARHLMLPMNLKGAMAVINECEIHDLDFGMINEHAFFCTCGMGFDAFISKQFADAGKRGPVTYLENVLKSGITYKPETYVLTIDDDTVEYNAFLISCANASQYGNDAYIAPQASMRDGFLDVVIMEPFDLLEASQVSFDMFNKTLDKNSRIKTFKARHIHVKRERPGVIHYDGDPVEAGAELDIRLVPKGIKVVVNAHADKRKRRPNAVQSTLTDFFNDVHAIRQEVTHPVRQVKAINQFIQSKLK